MAAGALWRWLQDPYVVARFQKLCGLEEEEVVVAAAASEEETRSNNRCDHLEHRRDGSQHHDHRDHEQQRRPPPCPTERCCNGLDGDDDNIEATVTSTTTATMNGTSSGDVSSRKARRRRPGAAPEHGDPQPPRHGASDGSSSSSSSTTDQLHHQGSGGPSIMELPRRRNSLSQEVHTQAFVVRRKALHYLFVLGTELGNETFYITFFPFLFWNVDALLARRIIMVWVWVMFLGQSAKDLLRWQRPASPPVIKVEVFYDSEYGMPSTHAMSGTALPFAIFALTLGRFEYPAVLGLALACCWCLLVCLSRLYMGMHSVLDVVVGVLCSAAILSVLLPSLEALDGLVLHWGVPAEAFSQNQAAAGGLAWWLCGAAGGAAVALAHVAAALAAFTLDGWSTSRADTAQILAVGAGVAGGSRANRLLGLLAATQAPPERLPLPVLPGLPHVPGALARTLARLLLGSAMLLATKAALKSTSIPLACRLFGIPAGDVSAARRHAQVELPYRFITYGAVGFSAACLVPCAFSLIGLS